MPRVLIVTSMFLPYLAADMHRARLLAAYLPAEGWDVELLVPGDVFQLHEHFEPNAGSLSVRVPVHRAEPEWRGIFRMLNSRSLSWRAYRPLRHLGDRLLSQQHFDLVYFSCAQPAFFHLGIGWRRRFRIPFVLDFHDPWYSPHSNEVAHLPAYKRRVVNTLARFMEAATLKSASGLISVSPHYLDALNRRYERYGWAALHPVRQATIPFAATHEDFLVADRISLPQPDMKLPGSHTIVYTGAGGVIMENSIREICRLLGEVRKQAPSLLSNLRIQFFGTEPLAVGQTPALTRIISEEGMADICHEHPKRLSYLEALRRVMDADGLLILGVNDAAYSPSKLFLYGLSGKPILACMRKDSAVGQHFNRLPELGRLIYFDPGCRNGFHNNLPAVIAFLQDVIQQRVVDRHAILEPFLAPAMARRHAELFNACLEPKS